MTGEVQQYIIPNYTRTEGTFFPIMFYYNHVSVIIYQTCFII